VNTTMRRRSTCPHDQTRAPRLPWSVHRDLARLLADWSRYFKRIGSEAFSLLVLLEGLRSNSKPARSLSVCQVRQCDRRFTGDPPPLAPGPEKAGLVHTEFVPHTNNTEAFFEIRLNEGSRSTTDRPPQCRRIKAAQ
jgi:hypothetical protein